MGMDILAMMATSVIIPSFGAVECAINSGYSLDSQCYLRRAAGSKPSRKAHHIELQYLIRNQFRIGNAAAGKFPRADRQLHIGALRRRCNAWVSPLRCE
eukprot:7892299-Pyramimonas_sp.AAC.2